MNRVIVPFVLICLFFCASAQGQQKMWTNLANRQIEQDEYARKVLLNTKILREILDGKQGKLIMDLPLPDGRNVSFRLEPNGVMADELARKYPSIRSYNAISRDNHLRAKIDFNGTAFFATIQTADGLVYVDPDDRLNPVSYKSYFTADYKNTVKEKPIFEEPALPGGAKAIRLLRNTKTEKDHLRTAGGTLRKYRIAIAANADYSSFHGGTTASVLSAIITTMNRVNSVYENDLSITMEIVAENDRLIFLTPQTDPYDNLSEPLEFLEENSKVLNSTIGSSAYDIGHVFTTSSGGVARLGSVCATVKAEGTTGVSNPIGDPFDIDFVAHEIGHQFGGTHTFNGTRGNCAGGNRAASTAYEPGSGTTILAYAGICGSDNLQNNSDPFFHSITIDQILDFVTDGNGRVCAETSSTGNTPPAVTVDKTEYVIPANTPFRLDAEGSDADGDDLTYSWEQFDLGPAGSPNDPEGTAPLFRAFTPVEESFRIFPQLSSVVAGTTIFGEILPETSRELNFRVVVRDNNPVGGGIATETVRFFASDETEPFIVTSQNLPDLSFVGGSTMEVTWNVGLTNLGDFNTTRVNVKLSTDGGENFDIVLASETENDGSVFVQLPETVTTEARVMVEAVDNIFFNVNEEDFGITEATAPGYTLRASGTPLLACAPEEVRFNVFADRFGGFSETINISLDNIDPELNVSITDDALDVGESTEIIITNTGGATQNMSMIDLTGSTSSGSPVVTELELLIFDVNIENVNLISPANGAVNVEQLPLFDWEETAGAYYTFELATDAAFTNVLISEPSLLSSNYDLDFTLETNTQYFWRVAANNECGTSAFQTASFTTVNLKTISETRENLGIVITENSPTTVTSTLTIEDQFLIEDVNLINLDINHTWVSDLTVTLISPEGTRVELFRGLCDNSEDIQIGFDDESPRDQIQCPLTGNLIYQPENPLSAFDDERSSGTWTLEVEDVAALDGGVLNSWGLELSTISGSIELTVEAVSQSEAQLNWVNDQNNATSYEIYQKRIEDSDFTIVATVDGSESSFLANQLEDDTEYDFRVREIIDQAPGDFSNIASILTFPAAPENLRVSIGNSGDLVVRWAGGFDNIDSYILEQSGDGENFEEIAEIPPSTTSFIIEEFQAEEQFFFRIKTSNATGESPYSEVVSYVVADVNELERAVSIFPNPGSDQIIIEVTNSQMISSIRMTDLSGKDLFVKVMENGTAGYSLDTTALNSGIYLVRIEGENHRLIRRWIKN